MRIDEARAAGGRDSSVGAQAGEDQTAEHRRDGVSANPGPLPHRLTVFAAIVLLLALPTAARGQSMWGEIRLPGSVAAARQVVTVTFSDGHSDAGWLLDLARETYSLVSPDDVIGLFDEYVKYIDTIDAATHRWPSGVTLPTASASDADRQGLKHYVELLGLRIRRVQNRDVVEPDDSDEAQRHRAWLAANEVDVVAIAAAVNAGHPARVSIRDAVLPLPLPNYWTHLLKQDALPIVALGDDRSNALLYYGLAALDDETLSFLETKPQLLDFLRSDASGVFSQFGRSIHIREGAVEVPGGASAIRVWQDLVGASPQQPERFIHQLLDRDDGRLAFFFDTVSHVTATRQSFVLGPATPNASHAADGVKDVYWWFKSDASEWVIPNRPFYRPHFDVSLVIDAVDVRADGLIGPAWWPTLLERVTGSTGWPDHPERLLKSLKDRPANAAWLLDWIFEVRTDAVRRWQLFRFLQRNFARSPRDMAPWIESDLRAFRDMPALALSLERMGEADPVTFGAVARAAHALTVSGSEDDVVPVLGRWQAALALLEQIQRRRHLPTKTVQELLTSLARAAPSRPDADRGSVATWVTDQLLPNFVSAETTPDRIEHEAIVGFTAAPAASVTRVAWEGLDYVLDEGPPVAKGAIAIRDIQRLPRLGDLVALQRVRTRLSRPLTSLDELKGNTTDLAALESALAALPPVKGQPPDIVNDFHDAVVALQRITQAKDLRRASRALEVVSRALDAITDAILPSLDYALAVSPSEQPASVFAAAWTSHALTPRSEGDPRHWPDLIWQPPNAEDKPGGGVLLRGSFLGLDLALADSQLRHASAPDAKMHSVLDDNDRAVIVQSLVLRNSADFTDDRAVSEVVSSVLAGRRQVTAWMASPPPATTVRQSLLRTTMDEWRLNLVVWQLTRDPKTALDELSEMEVFQLSEANALPSGWGSAARPLDACWCLESFRDGGAILRQHGFGLAASVQSDLALRLAELLSSPKLPIALVPNLLPAAEQDWIDHTIQEAPDDWVALTAWPKRLPLSRVDDYLLQLVSNGTLAPPHATTSPAGRR